MSKVSHRHAELSKEALSLIDRIREAILNRPELKNRDQINWTHIGDLTHATEELRQVLTFLNPIKDHQPRRMK